MKAKNFKSRHALLMSVTSLMLCVSMLFGATFAWFTDSVTSGVNRIIAGNLDIDATYWNGTDFNESITTTNDIFVTPTGEPEVTKGLWEPGHVEVAYLKVENKGTLALNYKIAMDPSDEVIGKNADGGDIKLSDILKVGMIVSEDAPTPYATREAAMTDAAGTTNDTLANVMLKSIDGQSAKRLYPANTENLTSAEYVTLIVYMPESTGNEANYRGTSIPTINFALSVVAQQATVENDSWDNTYDANATYGATAISATAKVTEGAEDITVTADAAPATGNETSVTFESGTITVDDNVTVTVSTMNAANAGSTFEIKTDTNSAAIGSISFDFGNAADAFNDNTETYATVNTVIDTGLNESEIAVANTTYPGADIKEIIYDPDTGALSFKTNHFSNFVIYNEKAVAAIDNNVYTTLQAAVDAAESGDTVVLLKDVTVEESAATVTASFQFGNETRSGKAVAEINKSLTLDGNHKTITANFTKNFPTALYVTGSGLNVNLKNLTIGTPKTSDILIGDNASNIKLNIDNCKLNTQYYVLKSGVGSNNLTINIVNSQFTGWNAMNMRCNDSTITVKNSSLAGINDKNFNSWNDFATIVFDGDTFNNHSAESDTSGLYGSGNTLNIVHSSVNVASPSGNVQQWLSLQYGAKNNTITVDATSVISAADDFNNATNTYADDSTKGTDYSPDNTVTVAGVQYAPATSAPETAQ